MLIHYFSIALMRLFLVKWEDSVNEKYPHIVYEELCKACDAEPISVEVDSLDNIEGL